MEKRNWHTLIAGVFLLVGVVASWKLDGLPSVTASGDDEFSVPRALSHLTFLAQHQRSIGSEGHQRAREYLVNELKQLGYDVASDDLTTHRRDGGSLVVSRVSNVVARLRGGDSDHPVVLMAHYDSTPTTNGASDNAVAVAAMLEVGRLLARGSSLDHTVVLAFTDAEEIGSLGSTALLERNLDIRNARAVFNFDARGTHGPTLLFETSKSSPQLVQLLARSGHPRGSSFYTEVYRRMPNDTDFTSFIAAGVPGLNFAFIDGFAAYHSDLDDVAHVEPRTIQHTGETMLALVRGGDTLSSPAPHVDPIFFDLFGRALIVHSSVTATILALIAAITLVVLFLRLRRTQTLRVGRVALGVGALAVVLVAAISASWLLWALLSALGLAAVHGVPSASFWLLLGVLCCAASTMFGGLAVVRRWVTDLELGFSSLVLMLIALGCCLILTPGASYLLQWPLMGGEIALAIIGWLSPLRRTLLLPLTTLPVMALIVPLVRDVHIALTLEGVLPITAILLVGMVSCTCVLYAVVDRRLVATCLALAICSAICATIGVAKQGFDSEWRQPSSLIYTLDADQQRAWWLAPASASGWARSELGSGAELRTAPPFSVRRKMLTAPAPLLPVQTPQVSVVSDDRIGSRRTVVLRIVPAKAGGTIDISVDGTDSALVKIDAADLQGRGVPRARIWGYSTSEILAVATLGSTAKVCAVEVHFGLSDVQGQLHPRPGATMPVPFGFGWTDSVQAARCVSL
jgi:hypothetical protein